MLHRPWPECEAKDGEWMDRRRVAPRPQDRSRRADVWSALCVRLGPGASPAVRFGGALLLPLSAADQEESIYQLDTGNLVGIAILEIEVGTERVARAVRIRARKLAGDPDADFDWLLTDLTRGLRSLAFTVDSPVALPVARSSRERSSPYEDLVFLRSATRSSLPLRSASS